MFVGSLTRCLMWGHATDSAQSKKKIFLFKGTTDILLQPEIYAAVIAQLKEVRNCLFYVFETIF